MALRFEFYRDARGKRRTRSYTKINDWLDGHVVPVRDVPLKYRAKYRATLLAIARAARDCNIKVRAASTFRTYAEQVKLYDNYLHHNGNLAAIPGTSRHEQGNAVDLYDRHEQAARDVPKLKAALLNRGLVFAVSTEAWHVEYHG